MVFKSKLKAKFKLLNTKREELEVEETNAREDPGALIKNSSQAAALIAENRKNGKNVLYFSELNIKNLISLKNVQ